MTVTEAVVFTDESVAAIGTNHGSGDSSGFFAVGAFGDGLSTGDGVAGLLVVVTGTDTSLTGFLRLDFFTNGDVVLVVI